MKLSMQYLHQAVANDHSREDDTLFLQLYWYVCRLEENVEELASALAVYEEGLRY